MISFVVIGKNEGRHLDKCFAAIYEVIANDHINCYEVIYVDSQSTDNSVEIAKHYDKINIRVFLITGECNAAVARNIGAKEAKGQILFFIDGDMEIQSGFLPTVLDQNGRLVYPFVSGYLVDYCYDENWVFIRNNYRAKVNKDTYQVVTGGVFLIEKELWNRVGGMDTRQKRSQDYDLALRLAKKGVKLLRKPVHIANHYMVLYLHREEALSYIRYSSLLFRKHCLETGYLKIFICQNYSVLVFWFSALLCWFCPWVWLVCLSGWFYRAFRAAAKNKVSVFKSFYNAICRDILFTWNMLFFWPQTIQESYKEIV